MDIGDIIRVRRLHLGMSQAQLATRLGISRNQVSNVETGKSLPSAKVLAALEEALETSFDDLLESPGPAQLVWLERAERSGEESRAERPGVRLSRLAEGPGQRLEPLRLRLAPGAEWRSDDSRMTMKETFVYSLEGEIEAWSGDRWFCLERRHALYIVGPGPAVWRNVGTTPGEILLIGGQ